MGRNGVSKKLNINTTFWRSAAFEQSSEPMIIIDASHRIIDSNRAARELTGRSESDLLGLSCNEFYRCDKGGHHCLMRRIIADGNVYSHEHDLVAAGGGAVRMFIMASPIMDEEGRPIGAVEVIRKPDDPECDAEELAVLSQTDPLTGLWNRRKLQDALSVEAARAARYSRPYSLAIIDIDHFKNYNDTFGHPAGDDALVFVSDTLKRGVRTEDLPVRYGGEEFVVLMPETDAAGAKILADRIRANISEASALENNLKRQINVSVGVSTCPEGRKCASNVMLSQADKALYAAKNAGRNRIFHHLDIADKK